MRPLCYVLFLLGLSLRAVSQAPLIQWQKCFGGSGIELAQNIQQTTDGGYIVCGQSNSADGDVTGVHGSYDYWITKLSSSGYMQWQKAFGGDSSENAYAIRQTDDGGYIVAGYSASTNGDVTSHHGGDDFWIVKISDTGALQWQKSFGGSASDQAYDILQTTDGGYIVVGSTLSTDGDVTTNHGDNDLWAVKLNIAGTIIWQHSFGGTLDESAHAVQQTLDGGYIIAGFSNSNDGDVSGNHGDIDCWVVKLDDTGGLQWQKSLGGNGIDRAFAIRQTTDRGFIVACTTLSNDGDVTGNHGSTDCWVVKLNESGAIQWQKCFGGTNSDGGYSVQETLDSGYIVGGFCRSIDGDVSGNQGSVDYWVIKMDNGGGLQWQKSLGGTSIELMGCAKAVSGGYIVAGSAQSNNGDVTGNHGSSDLWVVKLNCNINTGSISGATFLFCVDTETLYDPVPGGVWSMTNNNATISSTGFVTWASMGFDTAVYTITDACGSASAFCVIGMACEGAVHSLNLNDVALSPNPTSGIVSVTGVTNVSLNIYNMLGQLIKQANNTDNISISEFPAGIYFVKVLDPRGQVLKKDKIVKQ